MKFIDLAEAARRLGLAPSTLRHQIRNGRLRATKFGSAWVVTEREVERYRNEVRRDPWAGVPRKSLDPSDQ